MPNNAKSTSMSSSSNNNRTKRNGKKQKNNTNEVPTKRMIGFTFGILLLFLSIFIIIAFTSFIFSGEEDCALFGNAPSSMNVSAIFNADSVHNACGKLGLLASVYLINGLFGLASYFIPLYMLLVGLNMIGSYKFKLFKSFMIICLIMIWLSFILAVFSPQSDSFISLGGIHGRSMQTKIDKLLGPTGVYITVILSIIAILIYFSSKTIDYIKNILSLNGIKNNHKISDLIDKIKSNNKNDSAQLQRNDDTDELADEKQYEDSSACSITFDDKGHVILVDDKSQFDDETEPENTNNDIDDVDKKHVSSTDKETNTPDDTEFVIEDIKKTEKGNGIINRGDVETPYDPKLDLEFYKYPPLNLLKSNTDSNPHIDKKEQIENQDRIKHVLKSFGVEISSIKATIGPTITLYEITPAEGVRITKIRHLEDDIALSLAAEGIRIIAPIPGKGTIGIEVPNKKKCIVSMESVINTKTFQESTMDLPCALGKTITNEVFMVDLAKAPHMLVAGATGMGKSVGLNAIVTSLLYKKHPSELKIVMVDPKKVEFSVYAPIANQFLAKLEDEEDAIITENDRVVKTLKALCKLMDDRYLLLKKANVRNIKEYNDLFKRRKLNPLDGHEYMPYFVVIIDEFGDLIMTAGKEVELPICRIAQLARAIGIHMIIATQRPTTNIITGTIKANFPARIAFRVTSGIDSKIILDKTGANQLIGRGDMLYLQNAEPVRVQCAFVDTPEVKKIAQYISEQQQFVHMTYLPEPPLEDGDSASKDVDMINLDNMFGEVARMIVSQGIGSTSLIQRKFSIGYNRAGRLMDQLEKAGIVGPQQGSKPREVLISDLLSLDEILNNLGVKN